MQARIDAISKSREEARAMRNDSIAQVDDRVKGVESALQTVRGQIATTEVQLASSRNDLRDAETEVAAARRNSQMHRLAQVVFGRSDDASAQRMLGWFAAIAAGVLALAGSALAAVYYRAKMKNPSAVEAVRRRNEKFSRIVRGLISRIPELAARGVKVEPVLHQPRRDHASWDVLHPVHEAAGGRADPDLVRGAEQAQVRFRRRVRESAPRASG